MAAPDYVPVLPQDRPRRPEQLPPARPWVADRPGDFLHQRAAQPTGALLGSPGPDLGYALKLATSLGDRVRVRGEGRHDVDAGCVAVAMKRSALFGRAPVIFDLEVGYGVWGFLTDDPPAELVAFRAPRFEGAAHRYHDQRAIVDRVPEATLRLTPAQVQERLADWRSLLVTS
jgi:hypothetical protein